jgi:hypothetical protein
MVHNPQARFQEEDFLSLDDSIEFDSVDEVVPLYSEVKKSNGGNGNGNGNGNGYGKTKGSLVQGDHYNKFTNQVLELTAKNVRNISDGKTSEISNIVSPGLEGLVKGPYRDSGKIYAEPGRSVLIYQNGKLKKDLREGFCRVVPMFGNPESISIYLGNINHRIKSPVRFERIQREFPGSITLSYKVDGDDDGPLRFYTELASEKNFLSRLTSIVKTKFNGVISSLFKNPLDYSEEEYNETNNEFNRILGESFLNLGLVLTDSRFYIDVLQNVSKIREVEHVILDASGTADTIAEFKHKEDLGKKRRSAELLKAESEYRIIQNSIELDAKRDEKEKELDIRELDDGYDEKLRISKALHSVEILNTRSEARIGIVKSARELFTDLEQLVLKGETDSIANLSLMNHLDALRQFALIGRYDGEDSKTVVKRAIDVEFDGKAAEYDAKSYVIKNPESVRIAEALANSNLSIKLGESQLEELLEVATTKFREIFRGDKKNQASADTVNVSGETVE